jgi:hypothetical protein
MAEQRPGSMTIIMCYRGRRRRCEVVRVEPCPDCDGTIDLDARDAHQCQLPFDLPG